MLSQRKFQKRKIGLAIAALISCAQTYARPEVDALPTFTAGTWVADEKNTWQIKDVAKLTIDNEAHSMVIDQLTQKAIFNWESFDIGEDSSVEFIQLSKDSIALNKILSQKPSEIYGSLKANGQVYLINPYGIVFGEGSQINVGSLVASSLRISDEDKYFLNGNITQAVVNGDPAFLNAYFKRDAEGNVILGEEGALTFDYGANNTGPATLVLEDGESRPIGDDASGRITVKNGAEIKSAKSGSVMLLGADVVNEGKITAEDGQIILAATKDKLYIVPSNVDPNLRGFLIEVSDGGRVVNGETGDILSRRGNATLLGMAVNQSGKLRATTSVDVNGSVRLIARETTEAPTAISATAISSPTSQIKNPALASVLVEDNQTGYFSGKVEVKPTKGGVVKISGDRSVTEVIIDEDSGKAIDSQVQSVSTIEINAKDIEISKAAELNAKGGLISVYAVDDFEGQEDGIQPALAQENAHISISENVKIDVSGYEENLRAEDRIVKVDLRGTELADSPVQRDGPLRGKEIYVDKIKGTRLANIQGALDNEERSAEERLANGGQFQLVSMGKLDVDETVKINLDGGAINYAEGYIATSKLLYDRNIIDIADADPNVAYDGLLGQWTRVNSSGEKRTFSNPLLLSLASFQEAYVDGRSAGKLNIFASEASFYADVSAQTRVGAYQRDLENTPEGLQLFINLDFFQQSAQNLVFLDTADYDRLAGDDLLRMKSELQVREEELAAYFAAPQLPDQNNGEAVVGEENNDASQVDAVDGSGAENVEAGDEQSELDPTRSDFIVAKSFLKDANVGKAYLGVNGSLIVNDGDDLVLPSASNVTVSGAVDFAELPNDATGIDQSASLPYSVLNNAVDIRANISGVGAHLKLQTGRVRGETATKQINIADDLSFDFSGLLYNDSAAYKPKEEIRTHYVDAGSLSIVAGSETFEGSATTQAAGIVHIGENFNLKVDGGLYIGAKGNFQKAGKGGDLTISASNAIGANLSSNIELGDGFDVFSRSMENGGTFKLQAPNIVIKEGSQVLASSVDDGRSFVELGNELFSEKGFSNFVLSSDSGSVRVLQDTQLDFIQKNYIYYDSIDVNTLGEVKDGDSLDSFLTFARSFEYELNPVDLSVNARRYKAATRNQFSPTIDIQSGVKMNFAPMSNISFQADDSILFDAELVAPGANVAFTINSTGLSRPEHLRAMGIVLGKNSVVDVSAKFIQYPVESDGESDFRKIDAGNVDVIAKSGFIFQEFGSLVDISGVSASARIGQINNKGQFRLADVPKVANAGTLDIYGTEAMVLDGFINGQSGGPNSAGGSFTLSLDASAKSEELSDSGLQFRFGRQNSNDIQTNYYPQIAPTISLQADTKLNMPFGLISRDDNGNIQPLNNIFYWIEKAYEAGESGTDHNRVALYQDKLVASGLSKVSLNVNNILDNNENLVPASPELPIFKLANGQQQIGKLIFESGLDLRIDQSLSVDAPVIEVGEELSNTNVRISAPHIKIGSSSGPFGTSNYSQPRVGDNFIAFSSDYLEIFGRSSISGANLVRMNASNQVSLYGLGINKAGIVDPRFNQPGELNVVKNLDLNSPLISPATLNSFVLASADTEAGAINFQNSEGSNFQPQSLSYGGELEIRAANINHNGTISAPGGSLVFNASESLNIGESSTTTVSLDGLVLPFGNTEALSRFWSYDVDRNSQGLAVYDPVPDESQGKLSLPVKQISVTAKNLNVSDGAIIDLSGGGELFATEFIPGPGGSKDQLLPENVGNKFAIVPSYLVKYAPEDSLESLPAGYEIGQTIIVSGSKDLAAGEYTLLPAKYALLDNPEIAEGKFVGKVYLMEPMSGERPVSRFARSVDVDGTPVIAAKLAVANTELEESYWRGFRLEPGSMAYRRSQYEVSILSDYFEDAVNRRVLPQSAGILDLSIENNFSWAGTANAQDAKSNPDGLLAISGSQELFVGTSLPQNTTAVAIPATMLNGDQFNEVVLGANYSVDIKGNNRLNPNSEKVVIADNTTVNAKKIIVLAEDQVDIGDNVSFGLSSYDASEDQQNRIESGRHVLELNSNQASYALFVSDSNSNFELSVSAPFAVEGGTLNLGDNLDLQTDGALVFNAGASVGFGESLNLSPTVGQINVAARNLLVGGRESVSASLVPDAILDNRKINLLTLSGSQSIELAGDLSTEIDNLVLETSSVVYSGDIDLVREIKADNSVEFRTSNIMNTAVGGDSVQGSLLISTNKLIFSGVENHSENEDIINSSLTFSGFSNLNFSASETTKTNGTVSIDFKDALSVVLDTPYMLSSVGADTSFELTRTAEQNLLGNSFRIENSHSPNIQAMPDALAGLGASLSISANTIGINSELLLPSGKLLLQTGDNSESENNIWIGERAKINLAGRDVWFEETLASTQGGILEISAPEGDVVFENGSSIYLAGGTFEKDGILKVDAPNGGLKTLGNIITTHSDSTKNTSRFDLTLGDWDLGEGLGQLLNTGTFGGEVNVRLTEGDIVFRENEGVKSEKINITSDSGSIFLAGELDAESNLRSSVRLNARNNIILGPTSKINASVTGANPYDGQARTPRRGGRVFLNTELGVIQGHSGSSIINSSADTQGSAGELYLRIPAIFSENSAEDDPLIAFFESQISENSQLNLELYQSFDVGVENNGSITSEYLAEKLQQVYNQVNEQDGLGRVELDLLRWNVVYGVDVRSSDSITISEPRKVSEMVPNPFNPFELVENSRENALVLAELLNMDDIAASITIGSENDVNVDALIYDDAELVSYTDLSQTYATDPYGTALVKDYQTVPTLESCVYFPFYCVMRYEMRPGSMWNWDVAAGRDFSSPNTEVVRNEGSIHFTPGSRLLTSLGDIRLTAGQDISLGDGRVAIFSYGDGESYADIVDGVAKGLTEAQLIGENGYFSEPILYPVRGGSVEVSARGDIQTDGAQSAINSTRTYFSSWLPRAGRTSQKQLVTWGIIPSKVAGFGAVADGFLSINAGRDIRDVSIAAPSSGKNETEIHYQEQIANNVSTMVAQQVANEIVRNGGRIKYLPGPDIDVRAGRDFLANQLLIGSGHAEVFAQRNIGSRDGLDNLFVTSASASIDLLAGNSVSLSAVLDATAAPLSATSLSGTKDYGLTVSGFLSTNKDTAVKASSLTGETFIGFGDFGYENFYKAVKAVAVTGGDIVSVFASEGVGASPYNTRFPTKLEAVSFSGGLNINEQVDLSPSEKSQLNLLSYGNINFGNAVDFEGAFRVTAMDGDLGFLPRVEINEDFSGIARNIEVLDFSTGNPRNIKSLMANVFYTSGNDSALGAHVQTPLAEEFGPRHSVVSKGGNILGYGNNLSLAKQSIISAGLDIRDLGLVIQNQYDSDISVVKSTLGDIRFNLYRDQQGIIQTFDKKEQSIFLDGPGDFLFYAGSDIDFGAAGGNNVGVELAGNLRNVFLGSDSGALTMLAGMKGDVNVDDFLSVNHYLNFSLDSSNVPTREEFDLLNKNQQDLAVLKAVLREVRLAGREALGDDLGIYSSEALKINTSGYDRGQLAIDTLFPGDEWQGNIDFVFSRLYSTGDGDINMFVPGGYINVGAPADILAVDKSAPPKGIVSLGAGSIEAIARGDINVNKERIFTLGGGDIMLWSSEEDIDAGKGAATAISIPPPKAILDPNTGSFELIFPPAIDGSGIAALSSIDVPEDQRGGVYLFAPSGVIDAGDAGIRTSGNAFLGAQEILNADRIEVGGVSVGVPVASGVSAALAGAADAAGSATKNVTDKVSDSIDDKKAGTSEAVLEVEVLNESDGCGISLDDEFCKRTI